MAENAITFLLRNLSALLNQEAGLFDGASEEIRSIRDKLEGIHSFLKDADEQRGESEMVNVWVNQIRDVAYDTEDVIETYTLEVEQHQHRNPVSRFISKCRNLFTIQEVQMKLKGIKARLDEILTAGKRYGLHHIQRGGSSISYRMEVADMRMSPLFVEESAVVGFEDDAEKLTKALLAGESPRRAVVSIVGMGGLGKTTLAQCVYNRFEVEKCFQVRAWICVAQRFRVRDLLLSTLMQVLMDFKIKEQEKEMDEEALMSNLRENLSGKRYLVVFDDIWAKEAWDLIEKAFPDDKNGSRIMLTTRNRDVALYADPSSNPYDLHLLSKEKSWWLFCKKVFRESSCPTELQPLGVQIVDKAGGLPLAIVVLGGLLSTKQKSYSVWQKVLESADWYLTEDANMCLRALALSYKYLPYYLESCFLYFGMFPAEVDIEVDNLIRLWIAEGFIEERGTKIMEEVAQDYLEELIKRSMVQIVDRRDDGSALSCRIHHLLQDLAISEAKKERFLEIYGRQHSADACRTRRLTVTAHPEEGHSDTDHRQYIVESLRSLFLCFNGGIEEYIWKSFYGRVKLLKVLDLSGVPIKELPKEVGELILLKYLGLRGTQLRELPAAIGNLINLQTLDLRDTAILRVPSTVGKLHQLRHLFIWKFSDQYTFCRCDWFSNCSTLNRIDDLRDLRTLELKAGIWINKGFEKLTNLRRLRIEGELGQYLRVLPNSLAKFFGLRSLHLLEYSHESPLPLISFSHHMYLTELILSGPLLELPNKEDFPPNLAYLQLSGSFLKENIDPMATLEKLPKLRALKMLSHAYLGCKMTCSVGGFPNLRHLEISCLESLEEWIVEEGAMPNLRSLRMDACGRLKTLSDLLKQIPNISEVELVDMPEEVENW